MIEYLPWSNKELNKSLDLYKKGVFSILDLEVGGACNLSCIYCDSPDRAKASKIMIEDVTRLLSTKKISWVFLCGLGEPFAKKNRNQFIKILEECKLWDVRCSVFTNTLEIDDVILEYLDNGILNLLVKCDSLERIKLNKIYGSAKGEKCLDQIRRLEQHVNVKNGHTNIALSIVPTSLNYKEIPNIIEFAIDHNFYPLIGDLEDSGMSNQRFSTLKLNNDLLWSLKQNVEEILNECYQLPICPSVISGIHINHERNVVVDNATGLSCHWFWLKAPEIKTLCKVDSNTTYDEILSKILKYRSEMLISTEALSQKSVALPIGGCGGDIKDLLSRYVAIQKSFN